VGEGGKARGSRKGGYAATRAPQGPVTKGHRANRPKVSFSAGMAWRSGSRGVTSVQGPTGWLPRLLPCRGHTAGFGTK
jgi:hypothetical protein